MQDTSSLIGIFVLLLECLCCFIVPGIIVFFIIFSKVRPVEWIRLKNKVGKKFGKVEWVIPPNLDYDEQQIIENAHTLAFFEIPEALKKAPISSTKKSLVKQQADKIPDNIVNLMGKLGQVRRLRDTISRHDRYGKPSQGLNEIQKIEQDILAEVNYSMEVLSSIPIALVRLEISRGDFSVEKLLSRLDNANTRMKTLANTYKDDKQRARGW